MPRVYLCVCTRCGDREPATDAGALEGFLGRHRHGAIRVGLLELLEGAGRRRACEWCGRAVPTGRPRGLYCTPRCSQAERDYRRGRGGTPGVAPRRRSSIGASRW